MLFGTSPHRQGSSAGSEGGNPQDDGDQHQHQQERLPLLEADDGALLDGVVGGGTSSAAAALPTPPPSSSGGGGSGAIPPSPAKTSLFRSRKNGRHQQRKRRPPHHTASGGSAGGLSASAKAAGGILGDDPSGATLPPTAAGGGSGGAAAAILPSTTFQSCMYVVSRMVLWLTIVSLAAAVVWYSYELFNHGTDPHLIAWFSAGAFVILGFPISMFGIISHLANYNQPHVQVYVVRILWMVPIYSIESWLAMRFHKQAIYIETLRDLYESYVLYSFLQFLIQVMGGEEALILMLKDKSPTRGVHMWGLQWCVKPWLMGQPVRKISIYEQRTRRPHHQQQNSSNNDEPQIPLKWSDDQLQLAGDSEQLAAQPSPGPVVIPMPPPSGGQYRSGRRAMKRVHWKSPFFINCKFGVLQYVLLKFVSAFAVFILELYGMYKEGNFTPKGGYLYICILTNLSQCWALYCLIFFYYATRTELGPIRPVGKFLSVKSLVFFTWWQSVAISILYQMDMIPHYTVEDKDWSPEDVAKAFQDYLICIEMFLAAVVHIFVFPHTEYTPQAVQARTKALSHNQPTKWHHKRKRLGRKYYGLWKDDASTGKSSTTNENLMEMEMATLDSGGNSVHTAEEIWGGRPSYGMDAHPVPMPPMQGRSPDRTPNRTPNRSRASSLESNEDLMLASAPSWEMEDAIMRPPAAKALEDAITEEDEEYLSEISGQHRLDVSARGGDDDEGDNSDGDYEEVNFEDADEEAALSDDADTVTSKNPGFVRALLDSAIPLDLRDNTFGIVKGDYRIEKKTLLHHAATSDQYDIFSQRRKPFKRSNTNPPKTAP